MRKRARSKREARRIAGNQAIRRASRLLRSEEHTSELQSRPHRVCRLLPGKKKLLRQSCMRRGCYCRSPSRFTYSRLSSLATCTSHSLNCTFRDHVVTSSYSYSVLATIIAL